MINYSKTLNIRESFLYNKEAKEDIRIASIGDIHISQLVGIKDINNISESLYKLKPDYICMLGDLIDKPNLLEESEKIKELETLIKNSSSIAPTMIILGSHDFIDESLDDYPDVLAKTDVWNEINNISNTHLLNDELYKDNKILIAGYRQKRNAYYNYKHREDPTQYYEDFKTRDILYKELSKDLPKVLLTHSPEPILDSKVQELIRNYNVIITGHYHNGCVPSILDGIYPKNAGIITPRKSLFPKNARGIIKLKNGSYLIYSGGWTKMAECAPKLLHPFDKLFNRQIDLTTLTPNEDYSEEKVKTKKMILKR